MIDSRFHKLSPPLTLEEVCGLLGVDLPLGIDPGLEIKGVGSLEESGPDDLTFFHNPKYLEALKSTQAGFCLIEESHSHHTPPHTVPLVVKHPYRAFGLISDKLYTSSSPNDGISPFAKIHPSVKLGRNCHIGAFVSIGALAEIDDDTYIDSHTVIGRGVTIGKNVFIHNHVTISHAHISDNVLIKPGARIGQPGFGFHMDEKGHFDIPQLGRVIIEDNVQIGANTCIDRGSQLDTIIRKGVRIDNLVQIAHNVEVGENSVLVAQVGIAGSTKLGKFVIAAGQVGVAGHLTIGDGVKIAAQSGLMRDVDSGDTVGGSPAMNIRDWHRQTIALKNLIKKEK